MVVVCLVVTAACRSAPRAPDPCLGTPYLAVRNETGDAMDIYMVRGGSRQVLGTVGQGRTELGLPPEAAGKVSFQGRRVRDGRWIARAFGGRDDQARLDMSVECSGGRT